MNKNSLWGGSGMARTGPKHITNTNKANHNLHIPSCTWHYVSRTETGSHCPDRGHTRNKSINGSVACRHVFFNRSATLYNVYVLQSVAYVPRRMIMYQGIWLCTYQYDYTPRSRFMHPKYDYALRSRIIHLGECLCTHANIYIYGYAPKSVAY